MATSCLNDRTPEMFHLIATRLVEFEFYAQATAIFKVYNCQFIVSHAVSRYDRCIMRETLAEAVD